MENTSSRAFLRGTVGAVVLLVLSVIYLFVDRSSMLAFILAIIAIIIFLVSFILFLSLYLLSKRRK